MNVLRSVLVIAGLLLCGTLSHGQMIPDNVGQSSNGLPPALVNVGFDPQLNAQIPLDAPFVDEYGQPASLRQFSGKKPVVLAFVYFTCPMLCNQVEQALVGTLKMISFNPGHDYEVVFISFDPSDTPDEALKKKHEALSRFARPTTEPGWHFLTGTKESIDAVTKAANFRFSYDPKTKLFGHASGILLLTPDGRISRYFFGVEYPPSNVRLGLVDASAGKIGTPVDHILLFCYQYDPTKGRYSATILTVVRMGAVVTLFCMVIGFVIFRRRDHRAGSTGNIGPGSPTQGAH
ncbi:MAG TPA: SCO family protein [Candidatus Acidoferrum sp.]|nr:SCO family protein [Candidatus Acidoferrum sp.]